MTGAGLSWDVFDDFVAPRRERAAQDWATVDDLIDAARRYAAEVSEPFTRALDVWHRELNPIGGDPAMADWRAVRFLQLGREEAWSDWLQHLFATSTTGATCAALFGGAPSTRSEYAEPIVEREVCVGDYRADLVIHWKGGRHTHLEVKVGDLSFGKTFETTRVLAEHFGGDWSHFILLPEQDLPRWEIDSAGKSGVSALTWSDVAIAIRRGLRSAEGTRWRAWAAGFCGLVEQKLLGHAVGDQKLTTVTALQKRLEYMRLLVEGRRDE